MMTTLRYALRRLSSEAGYTAIHVGGLAVGAAACLLILLYIQHELSYDRLHENADQIVQIVAEDTDQESFARQVPGHLAADLAARLPEVEEAAGIESVPSEMLVEVEGERTYVSGFAYATPTLFDVFDGFRALAGDPSEALRQPGGAVLSASLAARLFGSADAAVGQTLATLDERLLEIVAGEGGTRMSFEDRGATPYTVRAVVEDPPTQSTVQFSALVPRIDTGFRGWNLKNTDTYLRLRTGTAVAAVEAELAGYVEDHAYMGAGEYRSSVTGTVLHLQPLTEVHLTPDLGAGPGAGPGQYLALFAAGALLILLIASANYVNLATARAVHRSREVGVRKTVGASRLQLWGQFLAEAGLVVGAALALGVVLAAAVLPSFEALLGVDLSLGVLATPLGIGVLAALFVAVTLGSGLVPAVVLARFRPAVVLKGAPTASGSGQWLRRGLVLFQFTASAVLIIATLGVGRQMDFVREARLDALDSQVVVVEDRMTALSSGFDAFKQELLADPAVASVSMGTPPNGVGFMTGTTLREGGEPTMLGVAFVGEDYVETLGLQIKEGTDLSGPHPPSVDRPVLINEAAVAASDLAALPTAVGALDTPFNNGDVVGVVEDYHYESFHAPIAPIVIMPADWAESQVLVRLREGQIAAGLDAVERTWNAYVPDRPLQFAFLDESLDEGYRAELRMSELFRGFALLGVLVAVVGLFGMAAYTTQSRTKEIGIRKVLGASVMGLVSLLSREYVALILAALAVAVPLALLGMDRWLSGFAYRADPTAALVIGAGGLLLAAALVAVGAHVLRAATADPVHALRSE